MKLDHRESTNEHYFCYTSKFPVILWDTVWLDLLVLGFVLFCAFRYKTLSLWLLSYLDFVLDANSFLMPKQKTNCVRNLPGVSRRFESGDLEGYESSSFGLYRIFATDFFIATVVGWRAYRVWSVLGDEEMEERRKPPVPSFSWIQVRRFA